MPATIIFIFDINDNQTIQRMMNMLINNDFVNSFIFNFLNDGRGGGDGG